MSEVRSALPGALHEGTARIAEAGPRGMITLRGDLSSAAVQQAVKAVAGVEVPGRGEARVGNGTGACWMSPDELLVLVPHGDAPRAVAALGKALAGAHHLVADVSDARALFAVSGPGAREVLAKLTPADLHPESFGQGRIRRTRLGQVAAAFWMRDETGFEVVCFRSQAQYLFDVLKAGTRPGAAVGYF